MNNDTLHGAKIVVHTDGSCRGNPGPAGYAARLRGYDENGKPNGTELVVSGGARHSSNNRMEMMAPIEALMKTARGTCVEIVTDSRNTVQSMTEWLPKWLANGWLNASKKPVENRDLLELLAELCAERRVEWRWVKGHNGDPDNEFVNELAKLEAWRFSKV